MKHSHIELQGIRRADGAFRLPLERVYVELRAERAVNSPAGSESFDRAEQQHSLRTFNLHEALALSHRAIIVGDPGSGKTTSLRFVARLIAEGVLKGGESAIRARRLLNLPAEQPLPFPLFTALANLDLFFMEGGIPLKKVTYKRVMEFLLQELERAGVSLTIPHLEALVRAGRFFVMLDGLDEIPGRSERQRVARGVAELLAGLPGLRVLMTSRTAAFDAEAQSVLSNLEPWRLQPMSGEELQAFLEAWFAVVHAPDEQRGRQVAAELLAEIQCHPVVREMASTPNIVTLIAILRHNMARLPNRRVELYREVIDLFLDLKDVAKGLDDPWEQELGLRLNLSEKRQLVATLALEMHSGGKASRTVPTKVAIHCFAKQLLDARRVPDAQAAQDKAERLLDVLELRSGLLRKEGYGVQFRHLGFQEWLAALALSRERNDQVLWKKVAHHLHDDWWNEVFRLLIAIQEDQSGPLLLELASAGHGWLPDWKLAGRGIALALAGLNDLPPIHVKGDVRDKVLARLDVLVGKKTQIPIKDRVVALRMLGHIGDPRLGMDKEQNWIWQRPGTVNINLSGSPIPNEKSQHRVPLPQGFWISRFPVTVQDFQAFVAAGGYQTERWWRREGYETIRFREPSAPPDWMDVTQRGPNTPIVGISWYEAMAYCRWLTDHISRMNPHQRPSWWTEGMVVSLPSEAQIEWAACSGDGRTYPWGNDRTLQAALERLRNGQDPFPVGSNPLLGTPEGVQDLVGNVWQWCSDQWSGSTKAMPLEDSSGDDLRGSHYRVIRGLSSSERREKLFYRSWLEPEDRRHWCNVGFRCVVAPIGKQVAFGTATNTSHYDVNTPTQNSAEIDCSSKHILYWMIGEEDEERTIWLAPTIQKSLVAGQTSKVLLGAPGGELLRWKVFSYEMDLLADEEMNRHWADDFDRGNAVKIRKNFKGARIVEALTEDSETVYESRISEKEDAHHFELRPEVWPVSSIGHFHLIRECVYAESGGAHGNSSVGFTVLSLVRPTLQVYVISKALARECLVQARSDLSALQARHMTDNSAKKSSEQLTQWRPSYDGLGRLVMYCQFTDGTYNAASDGRWSNYTRSAEVPVNVIPEMLKPFAQAPPQLMQYWRQFGRPGRRWGWTAVDDTPDAREKLARLFKP